MHRRAVGLVSALMFVAAPLAVSADIGTVGGTGSDPATPAAPRQPAAVKPAPVPLPKIPAAMPDYLLKNTLLNPSVTESAEPADKTKSDVKPAATKPNPFMPLPDNSARQQPSSQQEPLASVKFGKSYGNLTSLRRSIDPIEKKQAGATYEIISRVPSSNSRGRNDRMNDKAQEQLNSVVQELRGMGVSADRIVTRTVTADEGATSQTIDVYTK